MTDSQPGEKPRKKSKKFKVTLEVDVAAKLKGFDTAKSPTRAHRKCMKNYCSVLILGPRQGDDMLELMTHMFTGDEADAAQHLPPLRPRTARQVARRCGRPEQDVARHLDNLADNKQVILAYGEPRKYTILPVVPGTFEMALLTPDLSRTNHWHKKFAELFEKVWDTGFLLDYPSNPPIVRYLPVHKATSTLHAAWPSDKLEEILEPYDLFAVGHCQCRLAMRLVGKGCDRPLENCVSIGPLSRGVIDRGLMRSASKQEILDIKRNAEEHGCVTWMMNEHGDHRGNISCSCCGCCCHGLRTINQFSAPGLISAPHFVPLRDEQACNHCGKCALICPMGAWNKIGAAMYFEPARCIGCGLCATNCPENAITLEPVPDATQPENSFDSLFKKGLPSFLANTFKLWVRRTIGA